MLVYLIRHGIAEDTADASAIDVDRPLSEDGARRMKVQADALRRIGAIFDEIWTSPHLRACKTADILRLAQQRDLPVHEVPELAPDGDLDGVIDRLRRSGDDQNLALVGHEVGITRLAGLLLSGRTLPCIRFTCGAACCLEMQALDPIARAQLQWHLTPMQLRGFM